MSKYDKERAELGLKPVSSKSAPQQTAKKVSKYDKEREKLGLLPQTENAQKAVETPAPQQGYSQVAQQKPQQGYSQVPVQANVQFIGPPEQKQSVLSKVLSVPRAINNNITAFTDAAANTMTFGAYNKMADIAGRQDAIDNQDRVAGTVGRIAGEIAPYGLAYKAAGKILSKAAPALGGLKKIGAAGVAAGVGVGTAKELGDAAFDYYGDNPPDLGRNWIADKTGIESIGDTENELANRLKRIAFEGTLGGAIDVALPVVGKGIKKISDATGLSSAIADGISNLKGKMNPAPSYQGIDLTTNIGSKPTKVQPNIAKKETKVNPKSVTEENYLNSVKEIRELEVRMAKGETNLRSRVIELSDITYDMEIALKKKGYSQEKIEELTSSMDYIRDGRLTKTEINATPTAEPRAEPITQLPPKAEPQVPKAEPPKIAPKSKVQSQIEQIDNDFKVYKERREADIRNGTLVRDEANKQIKGRAMVISAQKRELIQGDSLVKVEGGLTDKELADKIKKLRTNYSGKEVVVNGQEGVITKNSFGKVGVQFADGSEKFFMPEQIKPKVDIDELIKKQSVKVEPKVEPSRYAAEREAINTEKPSKYAAERAANKEQPPKVDETKFAQTVKESPNTPKELVKELDEKPIVGARTTDVLNRQQADELIAKHGKEGLYAELISKKFALSPAESVAAQKLAKEYASKGGEENIAKAIALVSKTAREGREMGQAIQALSQWNKLDETGALLMGTRQLNRGIKDTADWKTLTTAQSKPLQDAAEKIGKAQDTKSLSDEVLDILTSKKAGEALTDAEKATIQKFRDQVKELDAKVKEFLPKVKSEAQETIAKIKDVAPKERTRDQVVNYLDAKADLARQRIAASRNRLSSTPFDIYADYAIVGASHIAKGARTLADYTEMMVKDFGQSVKPHVKAAYIKSVNIFRKENGLPTIEQLDRLVNNAIKSRGIDKETAESLKSFANEIGFYTDKNLKLEATHDLQRALKELGQSSIGEKVSTFQTGAQLLNVVTISRNAIGNAVQMFTEKINKMNAVPIDWALSKFTGERTIKFFPKNQEKYWSNVKIGGKSGWQGVSPTGTLASYDIRPEVFGKRNPLRYITKGLGATLQSFDYAAYRDAYGDVLATYAENLGKAQGLTKAQIKEGMPKLIEQLDDRIHELADQAGLYATFQDETLLSKAAEWTKKGLNKITDYPMERLVDNGVLPRKYSTQGFGLGDVVLKYARTPANLVMRAIDYSPIGFGRAIIELLPLVLNKSKFNQFEATRALSRAITGTLGLTGMGYILADVGVLTGSFSWDKDKRSIEEQSGQGSYKVNLSALNRFLTSGMRGEGWFSREEAKFQKGDNLMSYEWLQPTAFALAMGVNFNKGLKEANPDASMVGMFAKALLAGLSTVLENPMVQGLSSVIDAGSAIIKDQDVHPAKQIVKGIPTSFVPTLAGQARTATDNQQRETRDEKLLNEMINLVKNKLPGASKTLPTAYDSLGNARERLQGGEANTLGQYLTAFFSPAKFTKYEVSPEAKLVLNILEESGDLKVLPRIADRALEVNDSVTGEKKRVILTGKQFSDLQKNVGTRTKDLLKEYEYFLADPKVSIEEKTAGMSKILTVVGQIARNELRDSMGYQQKKMR